MRNGTLPPPYRYLDDIPHLERELYAGLVLSTHAHSHITVDPSPALAMEGVVDYVSVSDVPGDNMIGLPLTPLVDKRFL